jgi:flagellar biosynthesis GTPase FlhF
MYINRIAEENVRNKLKFNGAINIVGAKGVGKTELAKHFVKSKIMLKEGSQVVDLIKTNNNIALDGEYPRLIDEWQEHPFL